MIQNDRGGTPCVMNHMGYEKRCTNVFLYLDEADLSLHPRWQQRYVSWILKFVTSYFINCSVQILIATHSPIMLSDRNKMKELIGYPGAYGKGGETGGKQLLSSKRMVSSRQFRN